MRRIITYIAVSADGYIARPDGGVEWLDRPRPAGNYGMDAFLKTIDTILWGRKTWGGRGFGAAIKNFVFSHQARSSANDEAEFVNEPIAEFARRLRATPGKDVWIMGGAGIIASFLDKGQIDEFIIHVVPTFIGEGIPLVAPRHRSIPLLLRSCRRYPDGVVRLHYDVTARTDRKGRRHIRARGRRVT